MYFRRNRIGRLLGKGQYSSALNTKIGIERADYY
jgi:hypothetical protein